MALEHLLQAIEEKALEQINTISEQKERAILALHKEYEQKIAQRQKEQLQEQKERLQRELQEQERQLQLNMHFRLLEEKNKILQEIYAKTLKALNDLPEEQMKKIITYLVRFLPEHKQSHIQAGKKTAKILQNLLDVKGENIKAVLPEEGFIFQSAVLEIDMRFSQVLAQLRESFEPELVKMLFS